MTLTNNAYSVTTAATLISAQNVTRSRIGIVNNGAVTLYIGGSGVTTASGIPIPAGASYDDRGPDVCRDAYYGIVAAGTCDVRTMEN